MRPGRRATWLGVAAALTTGAVSGCGVPPEAADGGAPTFTSVQPELFGASGAQPNAWVDFDNDGDQDLFVGFRDKADRLYRNDNGVFTDVAGDVGLATQLDTRAAAWGDFDADGNLDVYLGFPANPDTPDRLYRNPGGGLRFVDVTDLLGVALTGTTRQASWIDYDGDADVDLFVAFRDGPNRLFRNDGAGFADVTDETGIGDARRTVGVAWFDMDMDGDLDAFVANQNGDPDGFFRNDRGRFVDVAPALGMDSPDRPEEDGGVGPAVADYDNDGDLDLFVANYGPDALWRNDGDGRFTNVADSSTVGQDHHSVTAAWGDFDNDGWEDVFVSGFLGAEPEAPDHLFRNVEGQFMEVTPEAFLQRGSSHGVRWADFDQDGDLDIALANNAASGAHPLYRNELPASYRARGLSLRVVTKGGLHLLAGSEVRIYDVESGELLGTRLIDSGGGYCSQGAAPVFFALPEGVRQVEVRVTRVAGTERVDLYGGRVRPAPKAQTIEVSLDDPSASGA